MAYLQTTHTGSNVNVTTLTTPAFGSSVGAGNLIVVGISDYTGGATNVSSVTDSKGNTYTRVTGISGAGAGTTIELWYSYNVTGGASLTVTVNFAITQRSAVVAQEFSGVSTVSPLDQSSSYLLSANSSLTYTSAATPTTTTANQLVVALVCDTSGGNTYTAGTGYSNLVQDNNDGTFPALESQTVSSTGAQTATVTVPSNGVGYTFIVATFKTGTSYTSTLTDTSTISDSITKQAGKALADTSTTIDTVVRAVTKTITETPSVIVEIFSKGRAFIASLSDISITSDIITRAITKTVTDVSTTVDSITKALAKTLTETALTLIDSILQVFTHHPSEKPSPKVTSDKPISKIQ
jgi:hypothetical protein